MQGANEDIESQAFGDSTSHSTKPRQSVVSSTSSAAPKKDEDPTGIPAMSPAQLAKQPLGIVSILSDDDLMKEYEKFLEEDAGAKQEAITAFVEMKATPQDTLDRVPRKFENPNEGLVSRRAPLNPLASPKLGKFRFGRTEAPKVEDPAMRDNPLRGSLIVTMNTSTILLFVFLQSLMANYIEFGRYHAPKSVNGMFGPQGETLLNLGGLDSNRIRAGETSRLFWSMWMHSGWLHIGLNVLCQIQFFYMFEPDWGFWRTFVLFWISGISGNLMSSIFDPCTVTVGSSGGLYGLMGAMIIYCLEYWNSIPRPICILVFTFIVLVISFITGFTGNTDNWAHLGGLLGGTLFCMATITSLEIFKGCAPKKKETVTNKQVASAKSTVFISPDGTKKKKQLKRVNVPKLGKDIPQCKCGMTEWITRVVSILTLMGLWFGAFWSLYKAYDFQPLGHITFSGSAKCSCCYKALPKTVKTWNCQLYEFGIPEGTDGTLGDATKTWGHFCDTQFSRNRRLREIENSIYSASKKRRLGHDNGNSTFITSRKILASEFEDGDTQAPLWMINLLEPSVEKQTAGRARILTGALDPSTIVGTSLRGGAGGIVAVNGKYDFSPEISTEGWPLSNTDDTYSEDTDDRRIESLINQWVAVKKNSADGCLPLLANSAEYEDCVEQFNSHNKSIKSSSASSPRNPRWLSPGNIAILSF